MGKSSTRRAAPSARRPLGGPTPQASWGSSGTRVYVGLEVHKDSIDIAGAEAGCEGEVH